MAATLAGSLCAPIIRAGEPGLIAHYNFSEGAGAVLHDVNGNGADAIVVGAHWVKSPTGFALAFDGKADAVDCGSRETLNLSGDLTIEAWINPATLDGRNKLIFGDTARLAVDRNYIFEIDQGMLYFGHGDGALAEQMLAPLSLGGWQHVAIVCEFPRLFFYRNGQEIVRKTMAFPITRTRGGPRYLGGWWAGHFQGEIGEVQVHNRALTDRELVSRFQRQAATPAFQAELAAPMLLLRQDCLALELWAKNFSGSRPVNFALAAAGRRARHARTVLTETKPGSERGHASAQFDLGALKPGNYEITATIHDQGGKMLDKVSLAYAYPGKPAWFGTKAGLTEAVLPPYAPLKVVRRGRTVQAVGALAWRYDFSSGPFPSQIESTGAVRYPWSDGARTTALLASPVRVRGTADGAEISFAGRAPRLISASPARVVLQQRQSHGKLTLTTRSTVEFDGFVKLDWRLQANEPTTVEQLSFEIPLNSDCARFLYDWPAESEGVKYHSGTLSGDYENRFKPIVWLGNEEIGLSWFSESDRNWHPADPARALQVVHQAGAVVLRVNLVQVPVRLKRREILDYTFALQATPVRPVTKDAWDYRMAGAARYGHDYELLTVKLDGQPAAQRFAGLGVRTFMAFNWTDVLNYFQPLGHEEQFRTLVQACHANGMQLIPYLGYQISARAPEFTALARDVLTLPENAMVMSFPDSVGQPTSVVCLRSCWQDAVADGVEQLVKRYDVDGVYLDSTCMPFACVNASHGCGYRAADGTLRPTYPIFGVRETFKRIYAVVKSHQPDGIVDAHVFDAFNSSALAFATSYWTGEQLNAGQLPLDRFRAEMMGYNLGTPAEFLHYKMGDYRSAWAYALLHDVPVRPELYDRVPLASAIWKLMEQFGRREARFLPYWRNGEFVSVEPAGGYVSLYRHPTNGVLAMVSNLSGAETEVRVRLQLSKLGLVSAVTVSDGLTGQPVVLTDGVFALKLASPAWQIVWIRDQR